MSGRGVKHLFVDSSRSSLAGAVNLALANGYAQQGIYEFGYGSEYSVSAEQYKFGLEVGTGAAAQGRSAERMGPGKRYFPVPGANGVFFRWF